MIHVGMSGFSYPAWIGEVYPAGTPRSRLLEAYAARFDAVEINTSFRRTPHEPTIDRWRDAVPERFRFAVKANQVITHWRRLVGAEDSVREFVARATRLGPRLGAVLFQVPANLRFDAAVLETFCAGLPDGARYAFEPRHESFSDGRVDEILRRHGIARCVNEDLVEPSADAVTAPLAYFRFHRPDRDAGRLADYAELLRSVEAAGAEVYAFFAHTDDPRCVRPALALLEELRG